MNPTDPDNEFLNDVEKYAATPDFLKGVDLGPSTLEYHQATPEISYEQYRSKKELEWSDMVMSRKSIYLDTRFWINLRDADLGRSVPAIYGQLLRELRRGVADGKLICPFAADLLAEVYKQSDRTTRLATARLIDELSLNVALQSEPERLTTELYHGIQAVRSSAPHQEPLRKLVWTCPSYVLGHLNPSSTAFDSETELALQKSFLDSISRLGFFHQVLGVDEGKQLAGKHQQMWNDLAARLNNLNVENATDKKSRKQIEVEEFSDGILAYLPALQNVIRSIFMNESNMTFGPEEKEPIERATAQIGGMICEAFRLGRLKTSFPTFSIRAGLATAVRWDHRRKYKANDFHDFGHAVAALPYFDVFATERSLRHLLVTDLKYNTRFAIAIEHEPEAILRQLIAPLAPIQ